MKKKHNVASVALDIADHIFNFALNLSELFEEFEKENANIDRASDKEFNLAFIQSLALGFVVIDHQAYQVLDSATRSAFSRKLSTELSVISTDSSKDKPQDISHVMQTAINELMVATQQIFPKEDDGFKNTLISSYVDQLKNIRKIDSRTSVEMMMASAEFSLKMMQVSSRLLKDI